MHRTTSEAITLLRKVNRINEKTAHFLSKYASTGHYGQLDSLIRLMSKRTCKPFIGADVAISLDGMSVAGVVLDIALESRRIEDSQTFEEAIGLLDCLIDLEAEMESPK